MIVPAADVEVWHVDLVACRDALLGEERVRPRLPPAHGFGEGSSRHLSHIALRIALERFVGAAYRGVPFDILAGGRRELPADAHGGRAASFSLSHTDAPRGAVALIAVAARGPIGIDVEFAREVRMSARHRAAIRRAANALAPHARLIEDQAAGTLAAWSRLEAVAKADGGGMARLLSHLGARGHGELSDAELAARATALLDRLDVTVRDLDVTHASSAAIAAPRGVGIASASFPRQGADIAALVAA